MAADHSTEPTKTCRGCKQAKPLTEFFFPPCLKGKPTARCKTCYAAATRKWQRANRDKAAEYCKKYARNNPEKMAAKDRKYREENRERVREREKEYRDKNRERIREVSRETKKQYRLKFPERCRESKARSRRKTRYGLTQDDYEKMLSSQGGVCAVCRQPETHTAFGKVTPLAVDHDHATGAVRGLLCFRCNIVLGFAQDDPRHLEALLAYLKRHGVGPHKMG